MSSKIGTNKSKGASPGSASQASNVIVRDNIRLPPPPVIATTISNVLKAIEAMKGAQEQGNQAPQYPFIIESRTASCWIPSLRAFSDWDIVATPHQVIHMIRQQEESARLKTKLIKQPLARGVIKQRPLTVNDQKRINALPTHLYKVSGEITDTLKFVIEVIDSQAQNRMNSSAVQLLNLCNNARRDELAYLSFSSGTEALKIPHIYWSAYFKKHIASLHTFRATLAPGSSSDSISVTLGYHADKSKPLTPPDRLSQIEESLVIRALEAEAFCGAPGAHINLNVSNDDLFVTCHIPRDDIHTMVMYGDEPIYAGLKTDKSKAMLSGELVEQTPYEKEIHGVKEEAMVISLERFLLPKLTSEAASAYRSALIRICTTLTKGWFRQFAVDSFPRLAVCDKDLLPIRDAILEKHSAPERTRTDPLELLKKLITNLDERSTQQNS
ncbi:hypothetical protein PS15p_208324 [Mucor circinelloides]